MQFDVSSSVELIYTDEGKKLINAALLGLNHLWAVPWAKQGKRDGITFHTCYRSAQNYIAKHHMRTAGREGYPSDKARLVPVSDWVFNWVSENGDFWAPIDYMSEAETFTPTIH